jgi:hypothetical protein
VCYDAVRERDFHFISRLGDAHVALLFQHISCFNNGRALTTMRAALFCFFFLSFSVRQHVLFKETKKK